MKPLEVFFRSIFALLFLGAIGYGSWVWGPIVFERDLGPTVVDLVSLLLPEQNISNTESDTSTAESGDQPKLDAAVKEAMKGQPDPLSGDDIKNVVESILQQRYANLSSNDRANVVSNMLTIATRRLGANPSIESMQKLLLTDMDNAAADVPGTATAIPNIVGKAIFTASDAEFKKNNAEIIVFSGLVGGLLSLFIYMVMRIPSPQTEYVRTTFISWVLITIFVASYSWTFDGILTYSGWPRLSQVELAVWIVVGIFTIIAIVTYAVLALVILFLPRIWRGFDVFAVWRRIPVVGPVVNFGGELAHHLGESKIIQHITESLVKFTVKEMVP
jgi:hypothetical protein